MNETSQQLDQRAVEAFAARCHGTVLRPVDEGYDEARSIWNATVDRQPALIVQCADDADVGHAVTFAREQGLPLGVLGGGHNVAGHAVPEDGLLIDLSSMTDVTVDSEARTVRVEGGATLADLDRATADHGLVTPGGIVSTTGVGGLTLGGGWGWLSRSLGLTIDNLLAAEVVTADGEVVTASAEAHSDLFWGIRGGGGNFGVVTAFEFRLHPTAETVLCGFLAYPFEDAGEILRFHREFTTTAPRQLCCYASVRTAPDAPFVPEAVRGEKIVAMYLCYAGDVAEGERLIEPLRAVHEPLVDLVDPRPYVEFQQLFDDVYPPGFRNYWKSGYVDESGLSDAAIEELLARAATVESPYTSIVIEHLGGAIADVPADATAYAHREAGYAFNVFSRWADPDEDDHHRTWTREFFAAMIPHLADGVYVNFLGREGAERVRAAFGDNYDRLVAVKGRYDPENVFRGNQNVRPSGTVG